MAMIKFWRGAKLPASRDADTLYFVKDNGHLYLGNDLIADVTKLDTAQVEQILGDALNSYYTKTAIDGIVETINGDIATKADASTAALKTEVQAVDAKFEDYTKTDDLGALALKDGLTASEVGAYTKEEVNSAISTATSDMATNAGVDQKLASYRTSAAQDAIDATKATKKEVGDVDAKFADYRTASAQDAIDATKADKSVVDAMYTNEQINTKVSDGVQEAKDYSDGKLNAVVEQYLTGEGAADTIDTLNEIADWINNDEAGVAQIIADVSKNTQAIADEKAAREGADATINGEIDALQLQMNGIAATDGAVKAAIDAAEKKAKDHADAKNDDIAKGVEAHGWGDHSVEGYLKAADISGKEDKSNLKALAYKDTIDAASLINDKVVTKAKLEESVQASLDKADSALQSHQDISHLATKTEVATAKSEAVSEAGTAAQGKVDALANGAVKTNTEAIAAINNTETGILAQAKTAVQGNTTNTVKDCVDAINTMNNQVGDTVGTVNDIVSMLTWIEG